MHRVRDGRIVETEVYFGWNIPHKAPESGFVADGEDQNASKTG